MTKSKPVVLGFSVLVLVLLNYFIFKIAVNREVNLTKIPVVKENIEPRKKISEEDIDYLEVPSIFINDSFYTNKEDIINKYTDIRSILPKSSVFYKQLLISEEDLPDYPAILLKENQVAYSMTTDLVKLSGNSIVVGQKVDLYSTYHERKNKPIVDLLVKSVRVIGVKDKKGLDISDPESLKIPHIVLLAIDKQLLPIVRGVEEIATLELIAYSYKGNEVGESIFNEEADILNYLNYEK